MLKWWTVRQLRSRDKHARLRALETLVKSRSVDAISDALLSDDEDVQRAALRFFADDSWARGDLVSDVVHGAMSRLLQEGGNRAIVPLTEALKHRARTVRLNAAKVLADCQDVRVVLMLMDALLDVDGGVRQQAAIALGHLKDSQAIIALSGRLTDSSLYVRLAAANSLCEISGISSELRGLAESVAAQSTAAIKEADQVRKAAFAESEARERVEREKEREWRSKSWPHSGLAPSGYAGATFSLDNPNDFAVVVGLRKGRRADPWDFDEGIDFRVRPFESGSIRIPSGHYEVFFMYSNREGVLSGDDVIVDRPGVTVRIVRKADGNYNVRPS